MSPPHSTPQRRCSPRTRIPASRSPPCKTKSVTRSPAEFRPEPHHIELLHRLATTLISRLMLNIRDPELRTRRFPAKTGSSQA